MKNRHVKFFDSFISEGVSANQIKSSFSEAEKELGDGSSAEELADFLASKYNAKDKYEEILDVLITTDDDTEAASSIASVINENAHWLRESEKIDLGGAEPLEIKTLEKGGISLVQASKLEKNKKNVIVIPNEFVQELIEKLQKYTQQ